MNTTALDAFRDSSFAGQIFGHDVFCPKTLKADCLSWSEDQCKPFFDEMVKHGQIDRFWEQIPFQDRTFSYFMEMLRSPVNLPFFCIKNGSPSMFFLLDDIQGASARIHFFIAKRYYGMEGLGLGLGCLSNLFGLVRFDGQRLFRVIMAEILETNRLSIKYAMRCGFIPLARIGEAIYRPCDGDNVAKIIFALTPVEHERAVSKFSEREARATRKIHGLEKQW